MSETLWDNLDDGSGLNAEAAKSKRPDLQQAAPSQQPMGAGIKPADRRAPTTDQKKVRRQMAKNAADDSSTPETSSTGTTPIKESTMSQQPTESELVARLAAATSLTEQTEAAQALDSFRTAHRETVASRDSFDWLSLDALPPTREQQMFAHLNAQQAVGDYIDLGAAHGVTAAMHHHGEATDWLDDIMPTSTPDHVLSAHVRASANQWYENLWYPVKADANEFSIQAKNAAVREGTHYGLQAQAAASVFLDQIEHLHSKATGQRVALNTTAAPWGSSDYMDGGPSTTTPTYVSDGRTTQPVGVDPAKADTLDEWGLGHDANNSTDPKSTNVKGNAPSLNEGESPEGDKSEGVENPNQGQKGQDSSTWDKGAPTDRAQTQSSRKTAGLKCSNCGEKFEEGSGEEQGFVGDACYYCNDGRLVRDDSKESSRTAAEGQTCSVCGDKIAQDPASEDPQTWHHDNGEKHDHEAKPGGRDKTSSLDEIFAAFTRDGGDGIMTYADAVPSLNGEGVGINEGEQPEGDHAESPVQEQTPAQDKSAPTDSDRPGGGVNWGTTSARIPLATIGTAFRGKRVSQTTATLAMGLERVSHLDDSVGGVSARQIVGSLLQSSDVPNPVKQALAAHLTEDGGAAPFSREGGLSDLDRAGLDKELRRVMEQQNNTREPEAQQALKEWRKQVEDEIAKKSSAKTAYQHGDHVTYKGEEVEVDEVTDDGKVVVRFPDGNDTATVDPGDLSKASAKTAIAAYDLAKCATCGSEIVGHGGKWIHVGPTPDHPSGSVASEAHGIKPLEGSVQIGAVTRENVGRYMPLASRKVADTMPMGSVRITPRPDKNNRFDVVQIFGPATSNIVWQGYDHAEALVRAEDAITTAKASWPAECANAAIFDNGTVVVASKTAGDARTCEQCGNPLSGDTKSVNVGGGTYEIHSGCLADAKKEFPNLKIAWTSRTAGDLTEAVVAEIPNCDICHFDKGGKVTPAVYDGATDRGPWAYMCEDCFQEHGQGLGLGRGQRLVLHKGSALSTFASLVQAGISLVAQTVFCPNCSARAEGTVGKACPECGTKMQGHPPRRPGTSQGSVQAGLPLVVAGEVGKSRNCVNGNHSDCTGKSCRCSCHKVTPSRDFSGACAEGDHAACEMTHPATKSVPAGDGECLCPNKAHKAKTSAKTAGGWAILTPSGEPLWGKVHDSEEEARAHFDSVKNRKDNLVPKDISKYEVGKVGSKQAMPNPVDLGVKEGDFFYSSWGYDQTNIDFYQVVGLTGASVKVREVGKRVVAGDGGPSESVVPIPDQFVGPVQTKRVQGYSDRASFTVNSYSGAYHWDGTPKHQTGYGYGH